MRVESEMQELQGLENLSVQRVFLEEFRLAVTRRVSHSDFEAVRSSVVYVDEVADGLVCTLEARLRRQTRNKEPDYTAVHRVRIYPKTLWDWLKAKYAPRWFVKRFPVDFAEVEHSRKEHHIYVCPHLNVPGEERHMEWIMKRGPNVEVPF